MSSRCRRERLARRRSRCRLCCRDLPPTDDRTLAEFAASERRILLTDDKDFGEIVFRDNRRKFGVVFFRIPPGMWQIRWPQLQAAIAEFGEALLTSYTVIEERRIRSQPLSPG